MYSAPLRKNKKALEHCNQFIINYLDIKQNNGDKNVVNMFLFMKRISKLGPLSITEYVYGLIPA